MLNAYSVYIVTQQASQYIVAFHIAISYDLHLLTYRLGRYREHV